MISLFPLIVVAYLAYGWTALAVISTSITFALLAELLSSWLFLGRKNTLFDGSGIITGLLLAFILSPNTPLHVVAFGAVSAVIFGKCYGVESERIGLTRLLSGGNLWRSSFP